MLNTIITYDSAVHRMYIHYSNKTYVKIMEKNKM